MKWKEFFQPTIGKIIIFAVLIILGYANWYYTKNFCKFASMTDCSSQINLLPGLFPPLIFDEGVVSDLSNELKTNFVGWGCDPSAWFGPVGPIRATASCNIKIISIFYTLIYWYVLSSLLVTIFKKLRNKNNP